MVTAPQMKGARVVGINIPIFLMLIVSGLLLFRYPFAI